MTERELMSEAAGLIREHLWRPHQPASVDGKPWHMGRELNIWKRLRKGFKGEDINGAISVVRNLRSDWAGVPLCMTIFYWKTSDGFTSTPFLEQAIHYHIKRADMNAVWNTGGMSPIEINVRSRR